MSHKTSKDYFSLHPALVLLHTDCKDHQNLVSKLCEKARIQPLTFGHAPGCHSGKKATPFSLKPLPSAAHIPPFWHKSHNSPHISSLQERQRPS